MREGSDLEHGGGRAPDPQVGVWAFGAQTHTACSGSPQRSPRDLPTQARGLHATRMHMGHTCSARPRRAHCVTARPALRLFDQRGWHRQCAQPQPSRRQLDLKIRPNPRWSLEDGVEVTKRDQLCSTDGGCERRSGRAPRRWRDEAVLRGPRRQWIDAKRASMSLPTVLKSGDWSSLPHPRCLCSSTRAASLGILLKKAQEYSADLIQFDMVT